MFILVLKIISFLILNFSIVHSNEISFQDYCLKGNSPVPLPSSGKKSSGSVIMSHSPENGTWYRENLNCSVTFFADNNHFLLLTFSNVSLRNSSMDNLTVVYNGDKTPISLSGQQVCSNENCEGLKFDSGDFNNLTLIFLSANYTVPQNMTGFRAHYTVYNLVAKNGACRNRKQFLCENGHCISTELVCDKHNNCGDRSDETKCIISLPDTIWGIVVIVIAILSIIIFVPMFCCLAAYGTKNVVKSVTLTNQATPLLPATDCEEASVLLSSSDFLNCWPGTSYERSNTYSYGTSYPVGSSTVTEPKMKFHSMSEVCESQGAKL